VYDTAVKESLEEGKILFLEGDKAMHFYILLKGRVKLAVGQIRQLVHTVEHPGEVFGWTSLAGRELYSATAKCMADTKILEFNGTELKKVLEKDFLNTLELFRQLAGALVLWLLPNQAKSIEPTAVLSPTNKLAPRQARVPRIKNPHQLCLGTRRG
jgi:CRP-like cAMP-binding protein